LESRHFTFVLAQHALEAVGADQSILRDQLECGQDPDLDRGLGLRARGHRPQKTDPGASLYQILQILSVTLLEKTSILQVLQASGSENDLLDTDNQLILFDF
jgi:hypothetical protein